MDLRQWIYTGLVLLAVYLLGSVFINPGNLSYNYNLMRIDGSVSFDTILQVVAIAYPILILIFAPSLANWLTDRTDRFFERIEGE